VNPGHTQTRCRAGGTSGTRYRASSKWQAVHRSSVVSWMGSAYGLVLSIDQGYEEAMRWDRRAAYRENMTGAEALEQIRR